uniref:Ig-like domain-containing protein n=1 Tax=Macrostomum lignano TaxID=282301 RepID=A0A1I8IJX7_9PLAT
KKSSYSSDFRQGHKPQRQQSQENNGGLHHHPAVAFVSPTSATGGNEDLSNPRYLSADGSPQPGGTVHLFPNTFYESDATDHSGSPPTLVKSHRKLLANNLFYTLRIFSTSSSQLQFSPATGVKSDRSRDKQQGRGQEDFGGLSFLCHTQETAITNMTERFAPALALIILAANCNFPRQPGVKSDRSRDKQQGRGQEDFGGLSFLCHTQETAITNMTERFAPALALIILVDLAAGDPLRLTQSLSDTAVALGSNLTLSCRFSPQPSYIIWTFTAPSSAAKTLLRCQPALGSCGVIDSVPGFGDISDLADANGSLTVLRVNASQNGVFQCGALLRIEAVNSQAAVTVMEWRTQTQLSTAAATQPLLRRTSKAENTPAAPSKPVIEAFGAESGAGAVTVRRGASISLKCSAAGANPAPDIVWTLAGPADTPPRWLTGSGDSANVSVTSSPAPFGDTIGWLTLTAVAVADDGALVRCVSLHQLENRTSDGVRLNVLYEPVVAQPRPLVLELGAEAVVECSARGNPTPLVHLADSEGNALSVSSPVRQQNVNCGGDAAWNSVRWQKDAGMRSRDCKADDGADSGRAAPLGTDRLGAAGRTRVGGRASGYGLDEGDSSCRAETLNRRGPGMGRHECSSVWGWGKLRSSRQQLRTPCCAMCCGFRESEAGQAATARRQRMPARNTGPAVARRVRRGAGGGSASVESQMEAADGWPSALMGADVLCAARRVRGVGPPQTAAGVGLTNVAARLRLCERVKKVPKILGVGRHRLRAQRRNQSGRYLCVGANSVGIVNASFSLDVQYGPLVSAPSQLTVRAGASLEADCAADANPPPTAEAEWRHVTAEGDGGRRLIGRRLRLEAVSRSDAGVWRCQFENRLSDEAAVAAATAVGGDDDRRRVGWADVRVVVEYPPEQPRIEAAKQRDGELSLLAGDSATVGCAANEGSPGVPAPRLTWSRLVSSGGSQQQQPVSASPQLSFINASLQQAGLYLCTPVNSLGTGQSATLRVSVEQPPRWLAAPPLEAAQRTVTSPVNASDFRLACPTALALPEATARWLKDGHQLGGSGGFGSRFSVVSRSEPAEGAGMLITSHLHFRGADRLRLQPEDNGRYQCELSNRHGRLVTELLLLVEFPPQMEPGRSKVAAPSSGDAGITLSCSASGQPPPVLSWQFNGATAVAAADATTTVEEDPPYRRSSRLVVRGLGTYSCIATNPLGAARWDILLVPPGPPDPPESLTVTDVGWDFVTVVWQRGFDGGSPARHRLLAAEVGGAGNFSWPADPASQAAANATGLMPGVNYTFQVYAESRLGRSGLSQPVWRMTPALSLPKPSRVQLTQSGSLQVTALDSFCLRVESSEDGGTSWSVYQFCLPSGSVELTSVDRRLMYRASLCLTHRPEVCGLPTVAVGVAASTDDARANDDDDDDDDNEAGPHLPACPSRLNESSAQPLLAQGILKSSVFPAWPN